MEFPPSTRRHVREALDLATDPDIAAAQQEDDMVGEREEIDRILAEVERELVAERRTESRRVNRDFMGERHARRAARRAERVTLRALPTRLDAVEAAGVAEVLGEAA